MPSKITFLLEVSTVPADPIFGRVRVAGWSESHWVPNAVPASAPFIQSLINARAGLLPLTGSITGVRLANYTISGNRLIPGGATTAGLQKPGGSGEGTDTPQTSLMISVGSTSGINQSKQTLRAIPDIMTQGGEFKPTPAYLGLLNTYLGLLKGGQWYFPGRVLSNPTSQIMSVGPAPLSQVLFDLPIDGATSPASVRLLRANDDAGNNISGVYRVLSGTGNNIQLQGLVGPMVKPTGLGRLDQIAMFVINSASVVKTVVRKVGRPTGGYRGRQSRRQVA
jgi:hypothetical protein